MERYTYDLFEPSTNNDESLERLTKEFAPLHMKAWHDSKMPHYGKQYDLNVAAFAAMWLNKSLRIFMAYENTKPVGFLIGFHFRPMQYQATVFQVEDWYTGNNKEMEEGLFDFMYNGLRFMGCDELLITLPPNSEPMNFGPGWKVKNQFAMYRYVRK